MRGALAEPDEELVVEGGIVQRFHFEQFGEFLLLVHEALGGHTGARPGGRRAGDAGRGDDRHAHDLRLSHSLAASKAR